MSRLTFPEITDAEALVLLNTTCTDWDAHRRDWPRHGFIYTVEATHFFARGSALGRTLGEAVQRAIHFMRIHDNTLPKVDF